MYEKRRSSGDKIHREKMVKSYTALLQTEGRNKGNLYKNDDPRSWSGNCRGRELYNNWSSRNYDRKVMSDQLYLNESMRQRL